MIDVCEVTDILKAERKSKNELFSETELISRAAKATFDFVEKRYGNAELFAVFCGNGNNGSDALALCVLLTEKGKKVTAYSFGGRRSDENEYFLRQAEKAGVKIMPAGRFDGNADVIIDGIFGTGLDRNVSDDIAEIISKINACRATVISVDIPSGIHAGTGKKMKAAVKADATVAFTAVKPGLLLGDATDYVGNVVVADVGIKAEPCGRITDGFYATVPPRKKSSHKGNYGRISVIGGSDTMPGAPLMAYESAVAATRCGAGLVRLCVGEEEKCAYKSRVTEQTLFYLPERDGFITFDEKKFSEITDWSDSVVLGPGMGSNPHLPKIMRYVLNNYEKTLILDADALNALSCDVNALFGHKCRLILTPHVGEFRRLFPETDVCDIGAIKNIAKKYDCVLALKSSCTLITDGTELLFNVTGTPAQAKGGSGDVLAGAIAAFAATESPLKATATACYRLGLAAEYAAQIACSDVSVIASDVIRVIKNDCVHNGEFSADTIRIRNL